MSRIRLLQSKILREYTIYFVLSCFPLISWSQLLSPPRQNIKDVSYYSQADKVLLSNLMQEYIDKRVIEDHCLPSTMMTAGGGIHSDFDFLPFHRAYLENMESWLLLKGHPKFVPLPFWDPSTSSPLEFQIIDEDCPFACVGDCDPVLETWSPNVMRPAYLTLVQQSGLYNDLCDFSLDPISLPATENCCPYGLSRAIEGNNLDYTNPNNLYPWNQNYHDEVHIGIGGFFRRMASPSTPLFWLWHAYVDLIYKEWEISCPQSNVSGVDLYMKDHPQIVTSERDMGVEPNIYNGPQYLSHDIWCRTQNDGFTNDSHQDPIVDGVTPTHVYVRVRNRGTVASSGNNDNLKLYWSKGATALSWPDYWDGSITSPALMGDLIGSQPISVIEVGNQKIFHFIWYPPDPSTYTTFNNEPAHFCLLARIESLDDPMTNEANSGVWNLGGNVKNNNNIVWKNLTVIDNNLVSEGGDFIKGGNIYVGNTSDEAEGVFDFELNTYAEYGKITIFQDAEVLITMDDDVWTKWKNGGSLGNNIDVIDEESHIIRIMGDNASFRNLSFNESERGMIHVEFNFLTEQYPFEDEYSFHVEQQFHQGEEEVLVAGVLGGEGYRVVPPTRTMFLADAGVDVTISSIDSTILQATDIGEEATYTWYAPNGEIIEQNISIQVSPEVTSIYKLKVSTDGGLVDYDEVKVTVKPYEILSMTPNPASEQVTISYKINGAATATLQLVKPFSSSNEIFNLVTNSTSKILNISNLTAGIYSVILICDGVAHDSQTLVIQ
ncbi:tyrosinase family protein [bacterium]|nr:tyrosinase family protein [bacterium]